MDEPGGAGATRRRRRTVRRRAPERGHAPGVLLGCALIAGTQMTWGLVIPVLPVYAEELGSGAAALGVVVAAFGLGRLVIDIPAGALAQRVDQRRLLVASVAAVAVFTLLTAAVTSIGQLVAVRALLGLAGGVAITTGQALLSGSDPARLGRTMAALQGYQLAGAATGPVLGGLLVGIDARLPFLVGGGILVALVVLALARPVPRWPVAAPRTGTPGAESSRLLTSGLVGVSVIGFTIFFVRFGGQQFLFPLLAYEQAGLSPAELGVALAAVTLLSLGLMRLAGTVTDRVGRRPVVIVSTTVLGVGVLGFLAAESAVLFLAALVLTSVATAFTGPPTGAYLAESVAPQHRGVAVGIYRTCGDGATLVGPLLLGWLFATGRSTAAVLVLAGTTVLAALVFAVLTSRRRPRADRPSRSPDLSVPTSERGTHDHDRTGPPPREPLLAGRGDHRRAARRLPQRADDLP